jgi:hypothetical protein
MFKMWWVFFESMAEAAKEGKKALGHFLAKQRPEIVVSTRAPIAGVSRLGATRTRTRSDE